MPEKEASSTATPSAHAYRPDIDGLRAIAVLGVVLFHIDAHILRGGFTGVDVFFVISGFLISGHILTELKNRSFSLVDFYRRRINRIFPALLLTVAFCFAVGWFLLFNDEYRTLGEAGLAGLLYYPNLYLLHQTGYFDGASELKPFLHFWSLGVEEQFYFCWPILLMVAGFNRSRALILLTIAASFALSLFLVWRDQNLAFYLPFGRFWELLAGAAILPVFARPVQGNKSKSFTNGQSIAGLLLILASFLVTSPHGRYFPGFWALLPVGGAALLISAGPNAIVNRKFLSHPAALRLGLISYPLYLWHWPLLYFARLLADGMPTRTLNYVAVFLSLGFAWATYRYVELPLRKASKATKVLTARILIGLSLALVAIAVLISHSDNRQYRNHSFGLAEGLEQITKNECGLRPENPFRPCWCLSDARGEANAAVFGDSHAQALYPGLVRNTPPDLRFELIADPGCPPLQGAEFIGKEKTAAESQHCLQFVSEGISAIVENKKIQTVLIALKRVVPNNQNYRLVNERASSGEDFVATALSDTVASFVRSGKRVALLLDNPDITDIPAFCEGRPVQIHFLTRPPRCVISRQEYEGQVAYMRSVLRKIQQANPSVQVFDPVSELCRAEDCPVILDGKSLYSYTSHLSDYGNGRVGKALVRWLESIGWAPAQR